MLTADVHCAAQASVPGDAWAATPAGCKGGSSSLAAEASELAVHSSRYRPLSAEVATRMAVGEPGARRELRGREPAPRQATIGHQRREVNDVLRGTAMLKLGREPPRNQAALGARARERRVLAGRVAAAASESAAATRIQAGRRGRLGRRRAAARRSKTVRERAAATAIQSHCRGRQARKALAAARALHLEYTDGANRVSAPQRVARTVSGADDGSGRVVAAALAREVLSDVVSAAAGGAGTLRVMALRADQLRPTRRQSEALDSSGGGGGGAVQKLVARAAAGKDVDVADAWPAPYLAVSPRTGGRPTWQRTEVADPTRSRQPRWEGCPDNEWLCFDLAGPPDAVRVMCFDQLAGRPRTEFGPDRARRDAFVGIADWAIEETNAGLQKGRWTAQQWVELRYSAAAEVSARSPQNRHPASKARVSFRHIQVHTFPTRHSRRAGQRWAAERAMEPRRRCLGRRRGNLLACWRRLIPHCLVMIHPVRIPKVVKIAVSGAMCTGAWSRERCGGTRAPSHRVGGALTGISILTLQLVRRCPPSQ